MPRIDRTLALYALVLALGGAFFVLIFWTTGAVNLVVGQGLISEIPLSDLGRILYFAYPFVLVAAAAGAVALYAAKAEALAVALAGLPLVGVVAYYLVLTVLR